MTKRRNYKTIFSLRVMIALKEFGITPLFEADNKNKPGFKCWVYEDTPEFNTSLGKIVGGK